MAKSSQIRVMFSSRCNDSFGDNNDNKSLSEIRKDLKKEIESIKLCNKKLFEVWINEDASPQGGNRDSWDVCMQAVKDCDILISLANGNAGWANSGGEIGICHAELMTGLSQAPAKIRLIDLGTIPVTKNKEENERNQRFQDYIKQQNLFRGDSVKNIAELKKRIHEALFDSMVTLAQSGVREASKGKFHSGTALDWTRMDFRHRQTAIVEVLKVAINERSSTKNIKDQLFINYDSLDILILPNAIPAALSVAAAKELVGQPFLRDHDFASSLSNSEKRGGPLHIIGCHRSATETQATKLLGFPDATVVSAPFGVFVADNIQKVQFVFIINCRDETTTRHGLQRFFDWVEQTGEDKLIAKRALSRSKIVQAIAIEVDT